MIYKNFEHLIPDAGDLVEAFLQRVIRVEDVCFTHTKTYIYLKIVGNGLECQKKCIHYAFEHAPRQSGRVL